MNVHENLSHPKQTGLQWKIQSRPKNHMFELQLSPRYFYHLSGMKKDPWDNRPGLFGHRPPRCRFKPLEAAGGQGRRVRPGGVADGLRHLFAKSTSNLAQIKDGQVWNILETCEPVGFFFFFLETYMLNYTICS